MGYWAGEAVKLFLELMKPLVAGLGLAGAILATLLVIGLSGCTSSGVLNAKPPAAASAPVRTTVTLPGRRR
jgi:spore maturation protein SpmB